MRLAFDYLRYPCFSLAVVQASMGFCLASEPNLVELARHHLEQYREREGLAHYRQVLESDPSHLESLTEAAYLSGRLGLIDPGDRKQHYAAAVELAGRAVQVAPQDGRANIVMAWALGGLADLSPPRKRVELAKEMLSHLQKGLEATPHDALGWFVLGSLRFRVATAGFLEKMAARAVGIDVPDFTLADALGSYRRAVELAPHSIRYHRDFAIALQRARQKKDSVQVLERCSTLPALLEDDADLLKSVRAELRKQTSRR